MYEIIKKRFSELKELNSYKRIDEKHPLDIYIGLDELNKKSLAVILEGEIVPLESTIMITTKIYKRKDNKLNLSFNLQEEYMCDVFYKFCDDIITSTRNFSIDNFLEFILERWQRWIMLFTKTRTSLLSENEIRGLLGELIFLRKDMFNKYGIEKSVIAWQGCEKAHKDFEIENDWYEIKTIRQNGNAIIISSIEQLDAENDGNLVVIKLEDGNLTISDYITLNKYVNEIETMITKANIKHLFLNKLNIVGYNYDEGYDAYIYTIKGMNKYTVNKGFPRLIKDDLKKGIGKISYEIYLDAIKDFKIGE